MLPLTPASRVLSQSVQKESGLGTALNYTNCHEGNGAISCSFMFLHPGNFLLRHSLVCSSFLSKEPKLLGNIKNDVTAVNEDLFAHCYNTPAFEVNQSNNDALQQTRQRQEKFPSLKLPSSPLSVGFWSDYSSPCKAPLAPNRRYTCKIPILCLTDV